MLHNLAHYFVFKFQIPFNSRSISHATHCSQIYCHAIPYQISPKHNKLLVKLLSIKMALYRYWSKSLQHIIKFFCTERVNKSRYLLRLKLFAENAMYIFFSHVAFYAKVIEFLFLNIVFICMSQSRSFDFLKQEPKASEINFSTSLPSTNNPCFVLYFIILDSDVK